MRIVTPEGIIRVSMVRRGTQAVLARRVGTEFVLRAIEYSTGLAAASRAVVAELPRMQPAPIEPIGAPLPAMTECLNEGGDAHQLADRIYALGAAQRSAQLLGSALSSRQAFAETVYNALTSDEGRITRSPAAVAVFYTNRGRIIASPSASPAGELWTTLKAGSDHAMTQAIDQLIRLSAQRWEDP